MIYLTHIAKEETGRSGCIAMSKTWPPTDMSTIAGFAEVDPNGLFADDEEGDGLAKHLAACWNTCAGIDTDKLWPGAMGEMVEALQAMIDDLQGVYDLAKAGRGPLQLGAFGRIRNARAILAKLGR